MKKDQKNKKEQQDEFTDKQRNAILQEKFNFGPSKDRCEEKSLEAIIDSVIDFIKNNKHYNNIKNYIKKYWFTKQIEDWKENKKKEEGNEEKKENNDNKELNDDELIDIVKKDLKIRIANTMLALRQQKDINEKDIWFNNEHNYASIVDLQNDDNSILTISRFNIFYYHISLPYKPFFIKNPNDNDKLNGVCIFKHGDDENKTKWIIACFKNKYNMPKCGIQFQTNENNKITNVKIETAKDKNSGKSIYTISLNEEGKVKKITKEGEGDTNENYTKEIKQLLFEDKTNQHLTENIECELDSQQKAVFDNIKAHLGVVEEENKEEEKEEKKEKEKEHKVDNYNKEHHEDNTNIITQDINKEGRSENKNNYLDFGKEKEVEKENNTKIFLQDINGNGENKNALSCNCCGLGLSCLKSCTKESFVENKISF